MEAFSGPEEAMEFLGQLKKRKASRLCVGIALRDRTKSGELIEELAWPEFGAVTGGLGGGLLGNQAKWLSSVGSVYVPNFGPVIVGGLFAAAFGLNAQKTSPRRSPLKTLQPFYRLGLCSENARELETALWQGKVLVTYALQRNLAPQKGHRHTSPRQKDPLDRLYRRQKGIGSASGFCVKKLTLFGQGKRQTTSA